MPYDPTQLQTDLDFITSQEGWANPDNRRDYIRGVSVDAKANLDPESHAQLVGELWKRADDKSMLRKGAEFVGTALGETVKSMPAAGGAAVFGLSDLTGLTDTGSGTRLVQGVKNLASTAGQRAKQLAPGESRQADRDALISSLKQDLDTNALPSKFEDWLSGSYDNREIDDPDTRAFVNGLVSGISRASVAADKMGAIDPEQVRRFMESDRNPARSDSDVPGDMGAREYLADYIATKDPSSWEAFKNRVTETDQQYETRVRRFAAQQKEFAKTVDKMPEGLMKDLVQRSASMQESPIDLASAILPMLRGAKALQAAKAGGLAAAAGRVGKGMGEEALQEAGTEYLTDARSTAAQIAEAGAMGAVGSGVLEGGMAGAGALMRPKAAEGEVAPTVETPAATATPPTVEGDAMVDFVPRTPEEQAAKAAFQALAAPPQVEATPIAPIQNTVAETAATAVATNLDVLPATAAALAQSAQDKVASEEVAPEIVQPPVEVAPVEEVALPQRPAVTATRIEAKPTVMGERGAAQVRTLTREQAPQPTAPSPIQGDVPSVLLATPAEGVATEGAPVQETFRPVEKEVAPVVETGVEEGMEKKAKSFKGELEMSGVAYLNGDRWGIKQSSDGTFYVEQTVNGERKIVASNFPDIETAQVGAVNAAFPTAVEPTGTQAAAATSLEEGRVQSDSAHAQDNRTADKALVKPIIRRTGGKAAGASVAGQQSASANASRIATLRMLNDKVGAYPNEDFNGIDPSQINEVQDYMVSLQLPTQKPSPAPVAEAGVEEGMVKPSEITPETEAPDRIMDVPDAMRYLYGKKLSATDTEKVKKLVEKIDREARKLGKRQGGKAFYESDIDSAIEEVLAQKQTSVDFRKKLEQAKQNRNFSQELNALVNALEVEEAQLEAINADRGMFGVQWAERNVRSRATTQKAKIRDLKERIVALSPSKIALQQKPSSLPTAEVEETIEGADWPTSFSSPFHPDYATRDEDSYFATWGIQGDEQNRKQTAKNYRELLESAVRSRKPVSQQGWKVDLRNPIPEGYVRQGDLYVYQPETQKPSSLPTAEAETKPQTTPKTNATIEGQVPEIRVEERVNASEGGATPEAGSRNRPVSSGQVEEAKGQEEVGKAQTPPPVVETQGESKLVRKEDRSKPPPGWKVRVGTAMGHGLNHVHYERPGENGEPFRFSHEVLNRSNPRDSAVEVAWEMYDVEKKYKESKHKAQNESPKTPKTPVVDVAPVRASEANAGKIDNSKVHPSLISADGTRKQLYHGKAGEFPDAELKINPNNMTTLSGIGPAWFTTNKAQAHRFSVPKGNIMAPDLIALKKPLIIEGDAASISRGKVLRRLLDFDKGHRIKNKSRFQWSEQEVQEWGEFYPRMKAFLESEGVKKFKNGDSLAKFDKLEQMGASPNHIPITEEFRRRLDAAYKDLNHPDADPLNKLQKLEKEARVTLRAVGNPLADKMPSGEAIRLALQIEGYDGVVLLNTMADTAKDEVGEGYQPSDWVIPFAPEQVVSQKETEAPIVTEDFGAKNKLFSREKAEASGKRLREWGGQTSMGLDPSKIIDAINFAGYYLEGGARSFADFSATMVEKLGDWVTPYLRQWYEAVRYHPGFDSTGMDAPVGAAPASTFLPTPVELTEQPEQPLPEKPVMPSEGPIGISNAEMDKEAERLGNLPFNRPVQKVIGDDQLAQMALRAWAESQFKGRDKGAELVAEMMESPRVISSLEQAILGFELVRRHNTLTDATKEYLDNPNDTTKKAWEDAQRASMDAKYANEIAGADAGRTLRYRRMMVNLDFTLAGMLNSFKAAGTNAPISKEQAAAIKEISDKYDKLRKEHDELLKEQEKQANAIDPAILDEMLAKAKEEGILEGRTAARVEEKAKQEIEAAKKRAEKAKAPKESIWKKIRADAEERIANRRGKVYNDVFMLNTVATAADHVLIGASYIAEGITNITDWIAAMKASVPDLPDSQMQEVYDEGKALVDEEAATTEAPKEKPVKKAKVSAVEKVAALAAEGKELTHRAVYDLVKEKLVAGVTKEKVMEEVTKDLQELYPEITERQVRDMFSDYGKVVFPSQDDIAKQMRELRAISQLNSAIEDVEKLTLPKHTGLQREKATETVRLLRRVLNARMKENRALMEEVQSDRVLTSPLEAIKTRLNNQIQDLSTAINKRNRENESKKIPVEYDKVANDMRELRDQLMRILDDVSPKPQPTAQERIRSAMYAVDRQIAELQRRIKDKEFTTTAQKTPITAQLQVKKDERAALNEQLGKLKEAELGSPERTQEQVNAAAEKQLERDIKELERRIAEKDFAQKEGRAPEATAEIEALRAKKATLKEQYDILKEAAVGKTEMSPEKRVELATKALNKSIAAWQDKIDKGGVETTKRVSKTPETPELVARRKVRDELKKTHAELQKAKREAARDPVEEQYKRDKSALDRRIKLLQKRMDEGKFAPIKKKEKVFDKRLMDTELELERLQAKWGEMLFNHKMAQRNLGQKSWDMLFNALSLGRFLKTAGDLSAIGNQGNFLLFSNPTLSIKALGGMWKAMQSKEKQDEVLYAIRHLPEYESGEFKRAKLFLATDAGPSSALEKHEEATSARFVDKIPKWAGGGLLRASARAYTTYLDLIRVAAYLSMKKNLVEGGWFVPQAETTSERLATIAGMINNSTGRGTLGKALGGKAEGILAQSSPLLSTIMFAPRFMISRFAMALGFPIWTASKGTRRLMAQEYAKYVAGVTTAMFLASMFQDEDDKEMEFNPLSSDFLNTQFDNTRLDLMGGMQQPMVFMLRQLFGELKDSKGNLKPLRKNLRFLNMFREYARTDAPKFTDKNGARAIGDFLRGKLAPLPASYVNLQGDTDITGRPTDPMSELISMPVPLVLSQVYENVKAQQEDPLLAALLASSAVAGFRTSTREPGVNRSKMKTVWQELLSDVKRITGIE